MARIAAVVAASFSHDRCEQRVQLGFEQIRDLVVAWGGHMALQMLVIESAGKCCVVVTSICVIVFVTVDLFEFS